MYKDIMIAQVSPRHLSNITKLASETLTQDTLSTVYAFFGLVFSTAVAALSLPKAPLSLDALYTSPSN